MSEIEFEGVCGGDGESFCWMVDKETYIAIEGKESYNLEKSYYDLNDKALLRLYPESILDTMGIKSSDKKKLRIKLSVEVIDKKIDDFRGDYFYLSNFCPSPFEFRGCEYDTVEHAYQALKATNKEDHDLVMNSKSPSEAKRWGRTIKIRDDWEEVKDSIMRDLVKSKFDQNPGQARMLIQTGNAELLEGNTWGDTHFGVCSKTGVGENVLGKILMNVRKELNDENL